MPIKLTDSLKIVNEVLEWGLNRGYLSGDL